VNSESAAVTPADAAAESTDTPLEALLARCTFAPAGTAVRCALSGGPDSTALLALAVAADLDVSAVHVDHGLRHNSSHDAAIAAAIARHFDVPFHSKRVELDDGPNLEARARHARRAVIGPDALTGHTADDQAETLLLSLLRGTGATGLGAMRPGPSKPLLALRRADTHDLCDELRLEVATDPTNTDPRFRRNRVRNEILPLLDDVADRDVVPLLARTSGLLRDDDTLLDELAAAIDPTDARAVSRSPQPLARRALRRWIIDATAAETPDGDRHPPDLASIDRIMAVARGDAVGCDVAGGWRVERSQQRLRLFSTLASSS
jgi:tRNA(Ile)-lysidine synthase